jgi:hypothetical protein
MNEILNILSTYWLNGVFVLLACFCNAGMDSLKHSFNTSFARDWDRWFWNPDVSYLNKYIHRDRKYGRRKIWFIVIPAAFTDGWHQLKMYMLGFLFIAASLDLNDLEISLYRFVFYSFIWNLLFNPIYYKLRKW